jgi:hypothetical protein
MSFKAERGQQLEPDDHESPRDDYTLTGGSAP